MGILNLLKLKKEGKKAMTRDEKEIKKAEDDILEKGKDTQTEKDRIDESVAEQEKDSGTEDTQTAKDRIDESLGAKRHDDEMFGKISKLIKSEIANAFETYFKRVEDNKAEQKLDEAREKYGVSDKPILGDTDEKFTDEVIDKLLKQH